MAVSIVLPHPRGLDELFGLEVVLEVHDLESAMSAGAALATEERTCTMASTSKTTMEKMLKWSMRSAVCSTGQHRGSSACKQVEGQQQRLTVGISVLLLAQLEVVERPHDGIADVLQLA